MKHIFFTVLFMSLALSTIFAQTDNDTYVIIFDTDNVTLDGNCPARIAPIYSKHIPVTVIDTGSQLTLSGGDLDDLVLAGSGDGTYSLNDEGILYEVTKVGDDYLGIMSGTLMGCSLRLAFQVTIGGVPAANVEPPIVNNPAIRETLANFDTLEALVDEMLQRYGNPDQPILQPIPTMLCGDTLVMGLQPGLIIPITANFDGEGTDDLALFDDSQFHLDVSGPFSDRMNNNDTGDSIAPETVEDEALRSLFDSGYTFGCGQPIAADIDSDGTDDIGLFVPDDLKIEPGQVTSLLGPNGAGKSTLINSVMTLIGTSQPDGAEVPQIFMASIPLNFDEDGDTLRARVGSLEFVLGNTGPPLSGTLLIIAEDVEAEALATLVVNRLSACTYTMAISAPINIQGTIFTEDCE